MAQDRFFFLHGERRVVTTLGGTNLYERFVYLDDATEPDLLLPLLWEFSEREANDVATAGFDQFVRRIMRVRNQRAGDDFWPAKLGGPMHIHHGAPSRLRLPDDVLVTTVFVRFHELLYTGDDIVPLTDKIVHEIVIGE